MKLRHLAHIHLCMAAVLMLALIVMSPVCVASQELPADPEDHVQSNEHNHDHDHDHADDGEPAEERHRRLAEQFRSQTPINYYALSNYDNDPDLALAMRYDSELNGHQREIASQQLAERHYLAYLERETDSAQRSQVYTQLGVLFSTNWHREKGEEPDLVKAEEYFQLALEEEPERYGKSTLRARLNAIFMHYDPQTRIDMRMDAFKWVESFDEQTLADQWLRPAGTPPPGDLVVRSGVNLLRSVRRAQAFNMAAEAMHTDDPAKTLNRIISELPGTEAAEHAQGRLRSLVDQSLDELADEVISGYAVIAPLSSSDIDQAPVSQDSSATNVMTTEASISQDTGEATNFIKLVILIAVILSAGFGIGLLIYCKNKREVSDAL